MKKYIFISLFCNAILFFGCEPVTNSDIEFDPEPLTLINGFISPENDIISIEVFRTASIFDQQEPLREDLVISNAIVTLTNENQETIILPFNELELHYEISSNDFSVEPGKQYDLKVIVGQNEYLATTLVPENTIESISAEKITVDNSAEVQFTYLKVEFRDIPNIRNTYIVGAETFDGFSTREVFFEDNKFITDTNLNNDLLSVTSFLPSISNNDLEVEVVILNMQPIVFQLIRALEFNDFNNGDPFSQPIVPPNNIEGDGGYGVFGSYRVTTETFRL
ncbi:DUF4249 family protein [Aquimarina brevivitae]|uniref:Uncharacterized protein DUF4249 n=1 Tax=Aquimarina brevivitae TaxID=323412 RepID=A0A4V2F5P4_9FLAO|nr:DUF4249 family protein [Aquimarina brevivitae]RZS93529.1 uncharacterized protein DUF4249 [Aquimarina brevivitae]